jgi:hypothetical protein
MPNRGHHRTLEMNVADAEQVEREAEVGGPEWGPDAPRGARAVMNRVLKESATVPLFFAQTLIQSLRDVVTITQRRLSASTSTTQYKRTHAKFVCFFGSRGREANTRLTPVFMTTARACFRML